MGLSVGEWRAEVICGRGARRVAAVRDCKLSARSRREASCSRPERSLSCTEEDTVALPLLFLLSRAGRIHLDCLIKPHGSQLQPHCMCAMLLRAHPAPRVHLCVCVRFT